MPTGLPAKTREPHQDVVGMASLHLEEGRRRPRPAGSRRACRRACWGCRGSDRAEPSSRRSTGSSVASLGRLIEVVEREEADQLADGLNALGLGVVDEVGDAGDAAVNIGAAQLLEAHFFVGDRLHHVGSGHEHVAHAAHHEDEVGDGGAIDRAARAGPQDRPRSAGRRPRRACCGGRCRRSRPARPHPPGSGRRPSR